MMLRFYLQCSLRYILEMHDSNIDFHTHKPVAYMIEFRRQSKLFQLLKLLVQHHWNQRRDNHKGTHFRFHRSRPGKSWKIKLFPKSSWQNRENFFSTIKLGSQFRQISCFFLNVWISRKSQSQPSKMEHNSVFPKSSARTALAYLSDWRLFRGALFPSLAFIPPPPVYFLTPQRFSLSPSTTESLGQARGGGRARNIPRYLSLFQGCK